MLAMYAGGPRSALLVVCTLACCLLWPGPLFDERWDVRVLS